ncbi:hypothetical protein KN1_24040 [Stygiolobus caldivivus]|uniref:Uncharacterized protein n=1 Tax=Stygiolobus caldivivus TaxID=2824673 RepID=A0A8D5U8X1_9CREN|nr:hypothetical protein KN1_24040 [Stygiolobus caldivivus]
MVGRSRRRSWTCGVGLNSWSRVRSLLLTRCGRTCTETRAFNKWAFTCYVYTSLGLYSVGDRDEDTFREVKDHLPDDGGLAVITTFTFG